MHFDWRQLLTFGELLSFAVAWVLGIAVTLADHAEQSQQTAGANVARLGHDLQRRDLAD
ncbi:MAG: hypothetical protein AAF961_07700 [Planctomycetota bacterium]